MEIIHNPELQTAGAAFVGVVLALLVPKIFGWLKGKAAKTETMTDDQFIEAIEDIVNKALAKKKPK